MSEADPETAANPTRRALLLAGAGGAGVVALAACSPGSGTAPPPKKGTAVAKLSAIPVGAAIGVNLSGGAPAIVARPSAEQVVCFSAICTHLGCTVSPSGDTLNCPCHGSQFSAFTGKVLRGPALSPLPRIGVTVRNGEVVTA